MKRKTAVLLIIALLITAMTGCGQNDTSEKTFSGWEIKCMTDDDEPVADVKIQVCSKTVCRVIESDENGIAKFSGKEESYTLHLDFVPDEYVLSEELPDELNSEEKSITILFSKR